MLLKNPDPNLYLHTSISDGRTVIIFMNHKNVGVCMKTWTVVYTIA